MRVYVRVCVWQPSRPECECGKGILLTYKWMTAKILSPRVAETGAEPELITLTGLFTRVKAQSGFHESLYY